MKSRAGVQKLLTVAGVRDAPCKARVNGLRRAIRIEPLIMSTDLSPFNKTEIYGLDRQIM